jgi:hypothetical protein
MMDYFLIGCVVILMAVSIIADAGSRRDMYHIDTIGSCAVNEAWCEAEYPELYGVMVEMK